MARDNGLLNSSFLHRCRTIGYRHPKEIGAHWKDPNTLCENAWGERLEYWRLSSSEQDRADQRALSEAGYVHVVAIPFDNRIRYRVHPDRAAMQTVLDNGHKFSHWTHLYQNSNGDSVFYFKSDIDAVQFRLTIS